VAHQLDILFYAEQALLRRWQQVPAPQKIAG